MIIPTIIEKNVGYDIFSRLLKDRIILWAAEKEKWTPPAQI